MWAGLIAYRVQVLGKGERVSNDTISWSELAELTHATQVERFHFCGCEEGEGWYSDCPKGGASE